VQRYGKVPAVVNVKLKLEPAAMFPFHTPLFDVDVWATLSRLVQVTVVPVDTRSGLVPNALLDNPDAPTPSVIVEPEFVVGVGELGDDEEPPHADASAATAMTAR
jgi:hypothetical protein